MLGNNFFSRISYRCIIIIIVSLKHDTRLGLNRMTKTKSVKKIKKKKKWTFYSILEERVKK